jgi:hypothetical protein
MRALVLALLWLTALDLPRAHAQASPDASSTSTAEPWGEGATGREAQARWERGLAEHAAKRYAAASVEFAACYRLAPVRACLFGWAQAARLAGDCATARTLYLRYLDGEVTARQADAARRQLAVCDAALAARSPGAARSLDAARPIAAPDASPPVTDSVAATATERGSPVAVTAVASRSPWYRDRWGVGLTATGVAALAAGTLLYASSGRDASAHPATYEAYADRIADAKRTRAAAVVTLGAGAALATVGVLRLILRGGSDGATPPPVALTVDPHHVGIDYRAAF